ncbi:MAG: ABC transporter ATP-binding protein [Firmicutes bacterium]|jgi:branched-chain amino acid transport system ATP-binding protein|nr:ABC transporter ATP-binding protein [Bacillota bacterium]
MLEIKDLHVHYGGIHALKGISLTVPEGKIVTLIGANGAGKSTTLRAICGLVKPTSGSIVFCGENLVGEKTTTIIKKGITMVPEGRRVFPDLTVHENLILGAYARQDHQAIEEDIKQVNTLFPRLLERRDQLAGTLSGGEQQMLAVGRALMSRPRLLMMDEPSLGLAPVLVQDIFQIIRRINNDGMTILLIEQNAKAALELADYGYVLETGSVALAGTGKDLLADDRVRKVYLGES